MSRLCKQLLPLLAAALVLLSLCVTDADAGTVRRVGLGKEFLLPSIAARFARDGDTIEIDAGTYDRDAAIWKQNHLTLRGVNGRARLHADGAYADGKGIWVIKGNDVVVENIEFADAKVPDGNGAGIRIEGKNLTIRNCLFHHNENGVLGGANPESDILIENSEFSRNGGGTGQTHNIYIGAVRNFTLRYSYSHHAHVGHNVKSRALRNFILYNRLMDETEGDSSYIVDMPNGGVGFLIGNEMQQGQRAENSTIVSFGTEGLHQPLKDNALYLVNNTIVNDRQQGGRFLFVKAGTPRIRIVNNLLIGKGGIEAAGAEQRANLFGRAQDLVRADLFDYRLRADSPAVNAGVDPGVGDGFALQPTEEYRHPTQHVARTRRGTLDIGAHAYRP